MQDRVSSRAASTTTWLWPSVIALCVQMLALCVSAMGAGGCTLPRGTLGRRDSGALRVDAGPGDLDGGPQRDGGETFDAHVIRPDAAGDCVVSRDCPARIEGAWDECVFGDVCSETGSQRRTSTYYECETGVCVPHDDAPESRDCPRSTDGVACGEEACGECVASAGGSVGCDSAPSGSQSCTIMICGGSLCGAHAEMRACMPPGSEYCDTPGSWGACTRELFGGGCRRGRARSTCLFGSCSGFNWESEECTGC